MRGSRTLPLHALFLTALFACSAPPGSPEQQIRELVARAVAAAEARDAGAVKALISERYRDEQGRDKRAVGATVGFYLLRHHAIHMLTRVDELAFPEADRAEAIVFAGLAGNAIPSVDALSSMRADLYRFELELAREDGDWRVTRAGWRKARFNEFL